MFVKRQTSFTEKGTQPHPEPQTQEEAPHIEASPVYCRASLFTTTDISSLVPMTQLAAFSSQEAAYSLLRGIWHETTTPVRALEEGFRMASVV